MPPAGGVLDGRSWAPLRIITDGLTWRSAIFLLVHMAFGLAYFVALTVCITLSFGLLVRLIAVCTFLKFKLLHFHVFRITACIAYNRLRTSLPKQFEVCTFQPRRNLPRPSGVSI